MKKLYLTFLTCVLLATVNAQPIHLEWANSMGGLVGGDMGHSITTDDWTGNVYVTGSYTGTADFDPSPSTFNLTSNGTVDIFILKLDAQDNFVWAKSIGGFLADQGQSIITDSVGNVYVTGRFQGVVDFDPGTSTFNLTSNGDYDIFILKLDGNGNFIWAKSIGGNAFDQGLCITIDVSNNVYVTGNYRDSVDFDPSSSTFNLISNGWSEVFILKLDGNGNFVWAKSIGGSGMEVAFSVITVDAYAVYIAGRFEDTVDFDPSSYTHNLISKGYSDGFILKLDGNGNLKWVHSLGAIGASVECRSVTADLAGNVYVAGHFTKSIDFDPSSSTFNMTAMGLSYDIFVQKLDPGGNFIWAKSIGGLGDNECFQITSDDSANVYLTGIYTDTADFDPDTSNFSLISNGSFDTYILKLDSSGNFIYAGSVGGASLDWGVAIDTDAFGSVVYATGNFAGKADFDPSSSTFYLTPNGTSDIFILKLSECGQMTGVDVITACDPITWIDGVTYSVNNDSATYTLTNAQGCDSVVTLNLIINTVDVGVTVTGPSIEANATGASYLWLDCSKNYAVIFGDTSQTFTPSLNGDYAVVVTENGCTDTSDCISISTIGIQENNFFDAVTIFPNPTKGQVNINFGDLEEVSIKVFSAYGQLIYSEETTSSSTYQFELNTKPGFYILELSTQGEKQQFKLVRK